MKKNGFTLSELTIAMICIFALAVIGIRSLRVYINQDSDILKFRSVAGSVSAAVSNMINNYTMYPTKKGFADISSAQFEGEDKVYGGGSKFRKLFKSQFNILDDELKFKESIGSVPYYKAKDVGGTSDTIFSGSFLGLHCFTENKGITYCLPDTPENSSLLLTSVYIRIYLNKLDLNDITTYGNDKAVYLEVSNLGKVTMPMKLLSDYNNPDGVYIFDCGHDYLGRRGEYYNQCKALQTMKDVKIYANEDK